MRDSPPAGLMAGVLALALSMGSACIGEDPDATGFEGPHRAGLPVGWSGAPLTTIHLDDEEAHTGEWSVRLERTADSEGSFSSIARSLGATAEGTTLELVGWLRTEGVAGEAGLWLREDGVSGPVQFQNTSGCGPSGTTGWAEYRIVLPYYRDARTLVYGALLAGTGSTWVDDLQLFVDGVPIEDASAASNGSRPRLPSQEFAQGSGFTPESLTEAQVENLVVLGKLWGFLKYHHPRIVQGELSWDAELLRTLPAMLEADGRDGERLERTVERVPGSELKAPSGPSSRHDRPGDTFQRLSEDVAYLNLRNPKQADVGDYLEGARGARGLVIDIRNYPGEFMVFALGQHLVHKPTPFARFTHGDLSNPGAFV